MNLKELFFRNLVLAGFVSCTLLFSFTSCEDDEVNNRTKSVGAFFLSISGESAEYILQTDTLDKGILSIANNNAELELSGYTWIFNDNPSVAVGLIYQQGDPGIGLGYTVNEEGKLQKLSEFQVLSRFTSYGFFNNYALTSVGGKTPVDAAGNALLDANGNERTDAVTFSFIDLNNRLAIREKTITTLNIAGNGEQASLSGIVDRDNGEFLTGLVLSRPKDASVGGGSSTGTVTYPDSVWVAAYDADLNIKRIYRDDRISYSSGRFRSQYYSQIAKADDGTIYVFSGSFESTTKKPAGALRIKSGATDFDKSYYFNIEEKSSGYRFRKVWHITGDYFLLEFYNDIPIIALGAATQYAVVNVNTKAFNWVSGIPAKDKITSTGLPMAFEGKMYFPIVPEGADPAIYIIDPQTAAAVRGATVAGAKSINAIGRLHSYN
jgi:hypothetical protein